MQSARSAILSETIVSNSALHQCGKYREEKMKAIPSGKLVLIITLTLSLPGGSPLTSKIVWRYRIKSISALSTHFAVKGFIVFLIRSTNKCIWATILQGFSSWINLDVDILFCSFYYINKTKGILHPHSHANNETTHLHASAHNYLFSMHLHQGVP